MEWNEMISGGTDTENRALITQYKQVLAENGELRRSNQSLARLCNEKDDALSELSGFYDAQYRAYNALIEGELAATIEEIENINRRAEGRGSRRRRLYTIARMTDEFLSVHTRNQER